MPELMQEQMHVSSEKTTTHVPVGTTIVFDVGDSTTEFGYTEAVVDDIVELLDATKWVHCEASIGEVWVNPQNVYYVAPGRSKGRMTAAASGNSDHQRLVGGQSL
jgi:hypothetical protein